MVRKLSNDNIEAFREGTLVLLQILEVLKVLLKTNIMEFYLILEIIRFNRKVKWILNNPKECDQNSIQMQIMNLIKNIHRLNYKQLINIYERCNKRKKKLK